MVLQPLPLVGAPAVPVPAEASATELEDALPQVLPPVTAATAYPRPELVVQVMSDVVVPVPPTAPSSLSSGTAQPSIAEAGLLPLDLPVGCGARGKDPLLAPTSQASGGTEPQVGSSSPLISVELQAGMNLVSAGEVAGVAVDAAAPAVPCVPQKPPVPSVKLPTRPKAKGGNKAVKVTVDEVGKKNNIRRSSRSKAKADDHTLEKTARMAAKRNLEPPGNLPPFLIHRLLQTLVV